MIFLAKQNMLNNYVHIFVYIESLQIIFNYLLKDDTFHKK